jgi:hypothetical protein
LKKFDFYFVASEVKANLVLAKKILEFLILCADWVSNLDQNQEHPSIIPSQYN